MARLEGQPLIRADAPGRIVISDGAFKTAEGQEVVLLGGNYCLKSQPYYPDAALVTQNAKAMARGAASMAYKPPPAPDGSPRAVKPCVRLSVLMEGAMPDQSGQINPAFARKLEATIEAFGEQGVYVFFDIHQDAVSTTNGGEGYPWWVGAGMQGTAGCCGGCFSCCGGLSACCKCCEDSYIATPDHPLKAAMPDCIAKCAGVEIVTEQGEKDPWRKYAVGAASGNPACMNVGNANMRMNNSDDNWSRLITTSQVQNMVPRLYDSPFSKVDKALFFDPFVVLATYLCRLWEKYFNVVAVELMNEPCFGGLPNICTLLGIRRKLFSFYGAVLEALDQAQPPIRTPIAIDDWSSSVPGSSTFTTILALTPLTCASTSRLKEWAARNQLVQSFHYYSPPCSVSFSDLVSCAKKEAAKWGPSVPIWLSEYWEHTAQDFADRLAVAADLGCNAVTYWQYADTQFTHTGGWFKYPDSVTSRGSGVPVSASGRIDPLAWAAYEQTVEDGTYWGAYITGAGGAQMDVLKLVPSSAQLAAQTFTAVQGQAISKTAHIQGAQTWPPGAHFFFKAKKHL